MFRISKASIVLYTLLLAASVIHAQDKVGTTAANFLSISGGARAAGMGGAYVAVAQGAMAQFWNPAGITQIESPEVDFCMAEWIFGTALSHAAVVLPLGNQVVGLNLNQLDYGDEIITTVADPDGTGEYWSARDRVIGISYAAKLTDRFSLGGGAKFITQNIYHESSAALALDLGLLYRSQLKNLRIGMTILNFGTDLQLDGEDLIQPVDIDPSNAGNNDNISASLDTDEWPLPLTYCVGLAADVVETDFLNLTLAADALHPNNNNSYLRLGTELAIADFLYLRAGHSALFKNYSEEKYNVGAGLKMSLGQISFGYDFSYTDFGKLGPILRHAIVLSM